MNAQDMIDTIRGWASTSSCKGCPFNPNSGELCCAVDPLVKWIKENEDKA